MAAALSSSLMAPPCSTTPESIAGPADAVAATRGAASARVDVRADAGAGAGNKAGDATAETSSGLGEASVTFGAVVFSWLCRLAPVLPIWYPRKTKAHDKRTTATKS